MKHYNMTPDGRNVTNDEANAINDLTEDMPDEALPLDSLPPMTAMDPDPDLVAIEHKKKGGMEKALHMIEEYEKGLPKRDPDVPQYEE